MGYHSRPCVEVSRRRAWFVASRYFGSDGRCSGWHPSSAHEEEACDLREVWYGCENGWSQALARDHPLWGGDYFASARQLSHSPMMSGMTIQRMMPTVN